MGPPATARVRAYGVRNAQVCGLAREAIDKLIVYVAPGRLDWPAA